ncbi:glycosyltransferase family 2 protein [Tamlana sp. 62-3]|uniref:Glycosyltransferase family 2 protein n=1 Tax=Neotamlana sargassicola TaxID=2883125 RepID=A0A9X1IA63_9FLAO|nr:glycosyltransferase family 2 protein [Tamlana sargassicola]MCB4809184.1 glycosyltransferase family 2 protein [Tamlana sargassicola]
MNKPLASVIITTYNKPEFLKLVLLSYDLQTVKNFELIIADDGSGDETKQVIEDFKEKTNLIIIHVWHEDKGFRKTEILNKAILKTNSEYLIFTDGDCIARKDFVETHLSLQKENSVVSGGYFKLTQEVSEKITNKVVENQGCFNKNWLLSHGQPKSFKLNKLTKHKFKAKFLNAVTPTKATFDGMNVSCWKKDMLAVNGFNEQMKYGGLDREVGERMMNKGMTFLQIRYSAICVHLHHNRPYKNEETLKLNKKIRQNNKKNKTVVTKFGITKYE